MITVTHDIKSFIENREEPLWIYGAGKCGYWIGHYLNRCDYKWDGYFDRLLCHEDVEMNNKPVVLPSYITSFKGKDVRIIVGSSDYRSVIADLSIYESGINILCYVPVYKPDFLPDVDMRYDINVFLGYFRKKIYRGEQPTIICNSCLSGIFYRAMNMQLSSPTVNVGIASNDFVKLCANLREYMSYDLSEIKWRKRYIRIKEIYEIRSEFLSAKLDDIELYFVHDEDSEKIVWRWNYLRKNIDWDNLIFVLSDSVDCLKEATLEEFSKIPEKKYVITNNQIVNFEGLKVIYHPHIYDCWQEPYEDMIDLMGMMGHHE